MTGTEPEARVLIVDDEPMIIEPPTVSPRLRSSVDPGEVLSEPEIRYRVCRCDFGGDAGVAESYVSYVSYPRRGVDTTEPKSPHTLRGVGYVLRRP
jgi:two-component system OmpR family response regulator